MICSTLGGDWGDLYNYPETQRLKIVKKNMKIFSMRVHKVCVGPGTFRGASATHGGALTRVPYISATVLYTKNRSGV